MLGLVKYSVVSVLTTRTSHCALEALECRIVLQPVLVMLSTQMRFQTESTLLGNAAARTEHDFVVRVLGGCLAMRSHLLEVRRRLRLLMELQRVGLQCERPLKTIPQDRSAARRTKNS